MTITIAPRFVAKLHIPLPKFDGRVEMISKLLQTEGTNHSMKEDHVKKLARKTDGYSGADMKSLCMDAANGPLRELVVLCAGRDLKEDPIRKGEMRAINFADFRKSLRTCKASVAQEDLSMYEEFDKTFGGLGSKPEDGEEDGDDDNSIETS